MNFMLRQIKFHGILKNESNILSQSSRVKQVAWTLSSLSDMAEAHRGLDNLCVVDDLIFYRIDKEVELIFICQSFNKLPD